MWRGNFNGESTNDLWDQMATRERRIAAQSSGMRLSDWETMHDLDLALRESRHNDETTAQKSGTETDSTFETTPESAENETSVDEDSDEADENIATPTNKDVEDRATSEEQCDIISTLSKDIMFHVIEFLDPEDLAVCCMVANSWHFSTDERTYEYFCRRIYAQQYTRRKAVAFNITRWGSWRNMVSKRPRLRTQGLYILTHTHIKKPQLDMFTDWKKGSILECRYYRALKFETDGSCRYVLTPHRDNALKALLPSEKFKRDAEQNSRNEEEVHLGKYSVQRGQVSVYLAMPYAIVNFILSIGNESGRGAFTYLYVLEHFSVDVKNPYRIPCHHKVNASEGFEYTSGK